jgi:hypothetical protein
MRIRITESQRRTILNENRFDKVVDKVISEYGDKPIEDIIDILVNRYALDLNIINSNQRLNDFFNEKFDVLINRAKNDTGFNKWALEKDYDKNVLDIIIQKFDTYLSDEIEQTYSIKNPISQLRRLNTIKKVAGYMLTNSDTGDFIEDVMEGLINDAIDYIYTNYKTIKDMLIHLASVKKLFHKNYHSSEQIDKQFRSIGKKYGYSMIPKSYEWSFQKGGGQIQSIINYIKDVPKMSKKTRGGWQASVGEDPKRRGWNSRLWSAMLQSEIVVSHRDGKDTIYTLGPNADAFERGKLVGY